jgi:putative transposase
MGSGTNTRRLLKLGIRVSEQTIQRYLPKKRESTSQTWTTFLRNHAGDIWACDFTVVYDLLFRPIIIFVILELKTRLIIHSAVTRSPSDAWTAQQLREATPWGSHPKVLIRAGIESMAPCFHLSQPVQVSKR